MDRCVKMYFSNDVFKIKEVLINNTWTVHSLKQVLIIVNTAAIKDPHGKESP